MKNEIKVNIITQNDLVKAGCFDINSVIRIVETTLYKYNKDNVFCPDKVSIVFDQDSQSRINCLSAGFKDKKIFGMKYVSVFPENPHLYGLPNLTSIYILSELEKGLPVAVMEGALCSNLRTAAVGAIAAKYLSRKDSKIIGFIGAGEQAKAHFMAMKAVYKDLKECRIASRTHESENNFVKQMSKLYPDVKFITCNSNYELAVKDADIIVTAISGQEMILKSNWIKQGAFYCHVAGLEDEYSVALMSDKIVTDSWEKVKHRTQTLSRMYCEGLINDENIYADLYEIVKGEKNGRERDDEFIYFDSVGLSYIDTAVAYWMYDKVLANGLGSSVTLCDESMFDINLKDIIL